MTTYVPLIYGLRDADRYLYHYTPAATALDYILPTNRLRLSPYTGTNDPRESDAWNFCASSPTGRVDLAKYTLQELSEWMSGALQEAARVICLCRDTAPLNGEPDRDMCRRGHSLAQMWHYYGEKHGGVCLVFDRTKLIEAFEAMLSATPGSIYGCHGLVKYRNHALVPNLAGDPFIVDVELMERIGRRAYALEHLHRFRQVMLFEKAEAWQQEAEWRAIAFTDSSDPLLVPIEDALVAIIHGARMSTATSEAIIKLTDRPTVEHMGLTWKNGAPWYTLGVGMWSYANRRLFERREGRWTSEHDG